MQGGHNSEKKIQVAYTVFSTIFIPIAIFLKLTSARIFTNIEFRTEKFRFLKYYSIVDAVSLFMLLPISLVICRDLLILWLKNNNYCEVFYQLYIISFIWSSLNTFNSIISLSVAWNNLRNLKSHKISTQLFYVIIFMGAAFSIILHLPNLFINQISVKLNSSSDIYELKKENFHYYIYFEYSITFSILLLTLVFNTIHAFIMIMEKTTEYKSVIYSTSKSKLRLASIISVSNSKRRSSVKDEESSKVVLSNLIFLKDFNNPRCSSVADSNLRSSKLGHTKTKYLFISILFVFLIDLILKSTVGLTTIFRIDNPNIIQICLIFSIILTQISHIFIYFKFSDSFFSRFKNVFKKISEN